MRSPRQNKRRSLRDQTPPGLTQLEVAHFTQCMEASFQDWHRAMELKWVKAIEKMSAEAERAVQPGYGPWRVSELGGVVTCDEPLVSSVTLWGDR